MLSEEERAVLLSFVRRRQNDLRLIGGDCAVVPCSELSLTHKIKAVNQELLDTRHQMEAMTAQAEHRAEDMQLLVSESAALSARWAKDLRDFTQDVPLTAQFNRSKGHPHALSEHMERHFADKIAQKDAQIMTLRLKCTGARSATRRLEEQLRKRDNLAEGSSDIDYKQLQIHWKEYQESIEATNARLLELKDRHATLSASLAKVKEEIDDVGQLKRQMELTVHSSSEAIDQLTGQLESVQREAASIEESNVAQSQLVASDAVAPQVRDFVAQEHDTKRLEERLRALRRRIALEEYKSTCH